ncbi:DUF3592 domain-containing protein [Planctomycetota bacterium]
MENSNSNQNDQSKNSEPGFDYIGILTYTFLIVSFLLGLVFSVRNYEIIQQKKETLSWVQTRAKITKSKMHKKKDVSESGEDYTAYEYEVHISYEYTVDSQTYKSDRWAWDGYLAFNTESDADKCIDSHLPGKEINVYYDPNNPSQSFASRTPPKEQYGYIALGSSLTLLSLYHLLLMIRSSFKGRHQQREPDLPESKDEEPEKSSLWGWIWIILIVVNIGLAYGVFCEFMDMP